jgi:hypothetical protein
MNALERFLAAGPDRRAALENSLEYYIPPELRAWLGLANELNPVTSMERAGQGAERIADPSVQGWDKVQAIGDTASNMAGVVAPVIAGSRGAVPAVNAMEEAVMGWSSAAGVPEFMADEFGGVGFGGDAIAARGAHIMEMLKSGRGAEVTDEMLDMGDAADNARLSQWLNENYDLPMDGAARISRAREMGMDPAKMWYHGTPDARGMETGFSTPYERLYPERGRSGPYFLTDNRSVARTYADDTRAADYQRAEPRVLSLYSRAPDPLVIDAQGDNFRGIELDYVDQAMRQKYGDGPLLDNYFREADRLRAGEDEGRISTDALAAIARRFGSSDVVDVRNVHDTYTGDGPASTVRMFRDPTSVRLSSARFDPRLAHLRNLSAGVGGAVFMSDMFQEEEEPKNALSNFLAERGL